MCRTPGWNISRMYLCSTFSYSSPASETQVTWNMGDFLCNPQADQQSVGETSIADNPKTLLCTYKTCEQPLYHVRSVQWSVFDVVKWPVFPPKLTGNGGGEKGPDQRT